MRIAAMPLLQLVACAFATKCTGDVSTVAVTGEVTATLPVPPEVPWIKDSIAHREGVPAIVVLHDHQFVVPIGRKRDVGVQGRARGRIRPYTWRNVHTHRGNSRLACRTSRRRACPTSFVNISISFCICNDLHLTEFHRQL